MPYEQESRPTYFIKIFRLSVSKRQINTWLSCPFGDRTVKLRQDVGQDPCVPAPTVRPHNLRT
jgi:hypothetical protein